jgi:hypothetical protein
MSLEESKWRTGLSSVGLEPLVAPGLLAGCLEFSGGRIPPGFIFFGCCEYNLFFLVVVSTHVCAFSSTAFIFWLL